MLCDGDDLSLVTAVDVVGGWCDGEKLEVDGGYDFNGENVMVVAGTCA